MTSTLLIAAGCVSICLLAAVAFIHSCLVVVTVDNVSMEPALEHGDRVLAMRRWTTYWIRKEAIVLVWPLGSASGVRARIEAQPYIKRVAALAGETIHTMSAHAEFSAVGRGAIGPENSGGGREEHTWHIPTGHVFVLGDNRLASRDSREWGPIPLNRVSGIVLFKLPRKAYSAPGSQPLGLAAGQPAPPFAAETLGGGQVTLATYTGHAVAFLFIAPSRLCRTAIPVFAALSPMAAAAGIELVLVSEADHDKTRVFMQEIDVHLPVLVAPRDSNPFCDDYAMPGFPLYCLVDANGTVQSAGYPSMRWGPWSDLAKSWSGDTLAVPNDVL